MVAETADGRWQMQQPPISEKGSKTNQIPLKNKIRLHTSHIGFRPTIAAQLKSTGCLFLTSKHKPSYISERAELVPIFNSRNAEIFVFMVE